MSNIYTEVEIFGYSSVHNSKWCIST